MPRTAARIVCRFCRPDKSLRLRRQDGPLGSSAEDGCPPGFVNIIRSFHDGTRAAVVENGEMSADFDVTNGTKQGCILAPLLFIIFFATVLRVAFHDCAAGIPIHYCTDGDVFDARRLHAKTKVQLAILRDLLLFADDCALVAHMLADAQILFDRFNNAARRFGLTVSLKKTEVMCQSYPPHQTASASITAWCPEIR